MYKRQVQARQRAQAYASAGAQDEEGPANGQEIIFPGGLLRHGCAYARFQHGSMGAVRVVPSVLDDAGEPRRAVCQRKRSRLPVREKQGKRSVDFFPVQRFPCGRDGGGGIGSCGKSFPERDVYKRQGVYGRLFLFSPEAFFFFPDKTSGAERTEQVARTKEERARSSSSSVIRKCGLAPG